MVVGGDDGSTLLDTTEVYQDNEWRTLSGTLPRAMAGMAVTTFNNKILLFGKISIRDDCSLFRRL